MKIAVLGTGPVKRKQVSTALDRLIEGVEEEIILYAGTLDPDVASDAMRFATDWAADRDIYVEIVDSDGLCASYADIVLVAWDDAQVDAIEEWVRATKGRVLDLTNDLAEITLEGEPDEAQQPSDSKPVSKPLEVGDVVNGVTVTSIEYTDEAALIKQFADYADDAELGAAVRPFVDYLVRLLRG